MRFTDQLCTLAARPQGLHSSDLILTGRSTTQIGNAANNLVKQGRLFKAMLHAREIRYFTTPEAREAFVAAHKPRASTRKTGLMWRAAGAAPWAADAPAVETEKTVYTKCPSFEPRFREFKWGWVHG